MAKPRVAVIAGGNSGEREVSLKSGLFIFQSLDRKKYNVELYDPASDLPKIMSESSKIDVAFLAMHGRGGEDGTIQGFFELLNIPYTGSGVRSSATAIDKITAKTIYRANHLPVAKDLVLRRRDGLNIDDVAKTLHLPCVVKPAREGSSLGMSMPETKKELEKSVVDAWNHDPFVLIEQYIEGREFTVATIGNENPEALPVIEIVTKHKFFDFEAKYDPNITEEICPAKINPKLAKKLQDLAIKAHLALGCRGASRTDMMYDKEKDEIYLLETNTIPGMTKESLLPKAAKAAGYTFSQFLDRMIECAMLDDIHAKP